MQEYLKSTMDTRIPECDTCSTMDGANEGVFKAVIKSCNVENYENFNVTCACHIIVNESTLL